MGKRLIQQARGKGSPTYRSPSFRFKGEIKHYRVTKDPINGKVEDLVHCAGHTGPLMIVNYDNIQTITVAPEGIRVGDVVVCGSGSELKPGNVLPLKDIPEGTLIHNIESRPGDGGKFVRASGGYARVATKLKNKVIVMLPSKKQKEFAMGCRASVGVVAGSGRTEKPFLKAGKRFYKMKARNKLYPIIGGVSQNAVDHPFGNARSQRKSKARPISKNAPPGRKVGMVAARRTGRKRGR